MYKKLLFSLLICSTYAEYVQTSSTKTDNEPGVNPYLFDGEDLTWMFNANLPIPGLPALPAQRATLPVTPEQIVTAYNNLSTTDKTQVSQALNLTGLPLTSTQVITAYRQLPAAQKPQVLTVFKKDILTNNPASTISTLSALNRPTLPKATGAAAQYLANLADALNTFNTLIQDTVTSPTLATLPINTYLRNALLEICASIPSQQPAPTTAG